MLTPKNHHYYIATGWRYYPGPEDADLSKPFSTFEDAEKYRINKVQCEGNATYTFLYNGNHWWCIKYDEDLNRNVWTKEE